MSHLTGNYKGSLSEVQGIHNVDREREQERRARLQLLDDIRDPSPQPIFGEPVKVELEDETSRRIKNTLGDFTQVLINDPIGISRSALNGGHPSINHPHSPHPSTGNPSQPFSRPQAAPAKKTPFPSTGSNPKPSSSNLPNYHHFHKISQDKRYYYNKGSKVEPQHSTQQFSHQQLPHSNPHPPPQPKQPSYHLSPYPQQSFLSQDSRNRDPWSTSQKTSSLPSQKLDTIGSMVNNASFSNHAGGGSMTVSSSTHGMHPSNHPSGHHTTSLDMQVSSTTINLNAGHSSSTLNTMGAVSHSSMHSGSNLNMGPGMHTSSNISTGSFSVNISTSGASSVSGTLWSCGRDTPAIQQTPFHLPPCATPSKATGSYNISLRPASNILSSPVPSMPMLDPGASKKQLIRPGQLKIPESKTSDGPIAVETILMEMTKTVPTPLSAIHTPRKDDTGFPFPIEPKEDLAFASLHEHNKHKQSFHGSQSKDLCHQPYASPWWKGDDQRKSDSRESRTPQTKIPWSTCSRSTPSTMPPNLEPSVSKNTPNAPPKAGLKPAHSESNKYLSNSLHADLEMSDSDDDVIILEESESPVKRFSMGNVAQLPKDGVLLTAKGEPVTSLKESASSAEAGSITVIDVDSPGDILGKEDTINLPSGSATVNKSTHSTLISDGVSSSSSESDSDSDDSSSESDSSSSDEETSSKKKWCLSNFVSHPVLTQQHVRQSINADSIESNQLHDQRDERVQVIHNQAQDNFSHEPHQDTLRNSQLQKDKDQPQIGKERAGQRSNGTSVIQKNNEVSQKLTNMHADSSAKMETSEHYDSDFMKKYAAYIYVGSNGIPTYAPSNEVDSNNCSTSFISSCESLKESCDKKLDGNLVLNSDSSMPVAENFSVFQNAFRNEESSNVHGNSKRAFLGNADNTMEVSEKEQFRMDISYDESVLDEPSNMREMHVAAYVEQSSESDEKPIILKKKSNSTTTSKSTDKSEKNKPIKKTNKIESQSKDTFKSSVLLKKSPGAYKKSESKTTKFDTKFDVISPVSIDESSNLSKSSAKKDKNVSSKTKDKPKQTSEKAKCAELKSSTQMKFKPKNNKTDRSKSDCKKSENNNATVGVKSAASLSGSSSNSQSSIATVKTPIKSQSKQSIKKSSENTKIKQISASAIPVKSTAKKPASTVSDHKRVEKEQSAIKSKMTNASAVKDSDVKKKKNKKFSVENFLQDDKASSEHTSKSMSFGIKKDKTKPSGSGDKACSSKSKNADKSSREKHTYSQFHESAKSSASVLESANGSSAALCDFKLKCSSEKVSSKTESRSDGTPRENSNAAILDSKNDTVPIMVCIPINKLLKVPHSKKVIPNAEKSSSPSKSHETLSSKNSKNEISRKNSYKKDKDITRSVKDKGMNTKQNAKKLNDMKLAKSDEGNKSNKNSEKFVADVPDGAQSKKRKLQDTEAKVSSKKHKVETSEEKRSKDSCKQADDSLKSKRSEKCVNFTSPNSSKVQKTPKNIKVIKKELNIGETDPKRAKRAGQIASGTDLTQESDEKSKCQSKKDSNNDKSKKSRDKIFIKEECKGDKMYDSCQSSNQYLWDDLNKEDSKESLLNTHQNMVDAFERLTGSDWGPEILKDLRDSFFNKHNDNSPVLPMDYYLTEGRKLKQLADREDPFLQAATFFDSSILFILSTQQREENSKDPHLIYQFYKDILTFLESISSRIKKLQTCPGNKEFKLLILCLKCQSLLHVKLYNLKIKEIKEQLEGVTDFLNVNCSSLVKSNLLPGQSRTSNFSSSPHSSVSSPASSVHSQTSGYSSCSDTSSRNSVSCLSGSVNIPQNMLDKICMQILHFRNLHKAHDLWEQADMYMTRSNLREFFKDVADQSEPLTLHSSIKELVNYIQKGISLGKKSLH